MEEPAIVMTADNSVCNYLLSSPLPICHLSQGGKSLHVLITIIIIIRHDPSLTIIITIIIAIVIFTCISRDNI